jgi:hypothetical protein
VHPDQRVVDEDPARSPVDVAPAQAEQLALAHACREGQSEQGLERMVTRGVEEATRLSGGQRTHLRSAAPR